ncbi:gamma-glutamylcyclotransferase [Phormidium sp. CLA17]|nr:gamma-glutamylcyclotransferase [Leptolyngbya sp. Cla-17]
MKVFVYGTLKPGEINYFICDRWVTESCPAIAVGSVYHLPFGYPAMVANGNGIAHGVVLSFADSTILQKLDEFEQHDPDVFQYHCPTLSLDAHQYQRQAIAVFNPDGISLGDAWAYLMTSTQTLQMGGILVPAGRWKGTIL